MMCVISNILLWKLLNSDVSYLVTLQTAVLYLKYYNTSSLTFKSAIFFTTPCQVSCSTQIEQEFSSDQCTSSQCKQKDMKKVARSPSHPGSTEVNDDSHESMLSLENECHRETLDKQVASLVGMIIFIIRQYFSFLRYISM